MADTPQDNDDDLDAFFDAAEVGKPGAMRRAARNISRGDEGARPDTAVRPVPDDEPVAPPGENTRVINELARVVVEPEEQAFPVPRSEEEELSEMIENDGDLTGKYIAVEPSSVPGSTDGDPFILIPANIHHYLPWWGWLTIVLGLMVLVGGVVMLPAVSLNRLVSRLGDKNEQNVRHAMRQLVIKGDERTVKKLYHMATSEKAGLTTRLRAVDAMSLIERVPEVDRALLRLELASGTNQQVREAAMAARKQREAYKTRSQTP